MLEKNSGAWLCAEPLVRCPAQTPVNINDEEAKGTGKGGKVDAKSVAQQAQSRGISNGGDETGHEGTKFQGLSFTEGIFGASGRLQLV